jgi:hypothetical protein
MGFPNLARRDPLLIEIDAAGGAALSAKEGA